MKNHIKCYNVQISTYDGQLVAVPPRTIVIDPEVIAPWPFRAWAKFPTLFQLPSLYSAIIEVYVVGPSWPPMIKTLSFVDAVA